MPSTPRRRFLAYALGLGLTLSACTPAESPPTTARAAVTAVDIPARGSANSFDVATWNLSWFGDPGNGPDDEDLQHQNVRDVILGSDLDLWALQEVVDQRAFRALVADLPGYRGLLADDPGVDDGADWYGGFGDREQKVALLYKTGSVEVLGARVVLTAQNSAFAGRPPVEIRIRFIEGGRAIDAVVVLIHAKAASDPQSWERRRTAARALEGFLARTWPTLPVWVLGDFNDDVDTSITAGRPSPYEGFVTARDWSFTTASLSAQGASSTVGFRDVIDHHLVSDEAASTYVTGSVEVFRVDQWIPDYRGTTSDHYPVLARYTLGGG